MSAAIDLSRYISREFFGERPHVRGRRLPVATLAHSARSQNWDAVELAYQFGLTEAEVLAALLYYEQNHEEIEAQETAHQAQLDAVTQQHGA
jgi:uncharacterized protein (DUF433 family)